MRVLEFVVDKQIIKRNKDCDFSNIVAGTSGYLKAKFIFSKDDWNVDIKIASFWVDGAEYAVRLDSFDSCYMPQEALLGDKFYISVLGSNGKDYLITTNRFKVTQEVL